MKTSTNSTPIKTIDEAIEAMNKALECFDPIRNIPKEIRSSDLGRVMNALDAITIEYNRYHAPKEPSHRVQDFLMRLKQVASKLSLADWLAVAAFLLDRLGTGSLEINVNIQFNIQQNLDIGYQIEQIEILPEDAFQLIEVIKPMIEEQYANVTLQPQSPQPEETASENLHM